MSEKVSKCDWFKHLHVQVAKWEKKGEHIQSPSTYGCTCKGSSIDCIMRCLTKRLIECKCDNLVSKWYQGEVNAFFEFLQVGTLDSIRITKLVNSRKCILSLFYCFASYDSLPDLDRQFVISKFEKQNTENILKSVQTLIALLRSTTNIHSGVSRESFTKAYSTFNDTTWLRHMYRLCLMMSNELEGRMKWKEIHNGVDPNNAHTNPDTCEKKGITKKELISELRSLVPRWLQPFSCPRPYREEVQLLLAFLDGGVLDKEKIQREQKLRKIAIGLNDVLLTVLKMGNDLNEIIKTIEQSRRSQLFTCLMDIGHRLEALSQNTDELQAFSEDEHTSNQSNHDCETDRGKEPLVDAIGYPDEENTAEYLVTETMMNVSKPKATSHETKKDFDMNSESSCSHEKTYDLNITDDRDSENFLSDPMSIQQCLDLEQEVTHQPLISENILDLSFHQLLGDADEIVSLPLSPSNGDGLFYELSAELSDTVLNPNGEENSDWTDSKHSFTTDTCTHKTSYAVSDLTLGKTMKNVSSSPPTTDFTKVDILNDEEVLDVFYGLGSQLIDLWSEPKLRKFDERLRRLRMLRTKRSHQTTVQSEGSGGIGFPVMQDPGVSDGDIGNENSRTYRRNASSSVCYSSGPSSSETAVLSSEAEPNGSCSQSSLVDLGNPKEHLPNTIRRKRKRRAVDD